MFNPRRLELARKRRGFTKVALAGPVGIPIRTLTEYESGRTEPNGVALQRLAETLDFPVHFFEGDDVEMPTPESATFRARANLSARERDRALGGMALAKILMDYLGERFDLPEPEVPDLLGMQPQGAAATVRASWGLGERPIGDMMRLLESKGVRVFSLVESSRRLDAFAVWSDSIPYIFLNVTKSAERSRFDAAHELGHLVMHREGRPEGQRAEFEANRFAAAFLMPESQVMALGSGLATIETLRNAKKRFGVSVVALAHRMWELRLIKDWHYHMLCVQFSQLGYRTAEPDPMPRERSQLLDKVFTMLREDGVSKRDVAAAIDIHVRDLEELVSGLTLVQIAGGSPKGAKAGRGTTKTKLELHGGSE
jgi:Zn-dependent peptidase ImmA (M78 family)/DNA-binding XRE family transcriptional regulator